MLYCSNTIPTETQPWRSCGNTSYHDMDKVSHVLQDSNKLPFYQAEKYHQFHDGIGVPFPASYHSLKADLERSGKIQSTGCPEGSFFF